MSRPGLFVLFEGLPDTVIDSQALFHVREMRELGLVDFEVWSFACSAELYRRSIARQERAARISGGTVRVFRGVTVRPAMPATTRINALVFEGLLRRFRPRFELIHARTDYAAVVCSHLKRFRRFELVWDCRGDCVAEFQATYEGWRDPVSRLRRDLGTLVLRHRYRRAAKLCNQAIFVSETLRAATGGRDGFGEIIPCTASESLFFFDPALRAAMRERLGYPAETKILVYSGSLAPYQCFPETVELFRRLYKRDPSAALLVLTPETDAARRLLVEDLPAGSWQALSVPVEEVNGYLNAADFAAMVRRDHPLNRAATPTKFAEYGLAGLPVILNPGVGEMYAVARVLGLAIDYDFVTLPGPFESTDPSRRAATARRARDRLSRASVLPRYRRIYGVASPTLRPDVSSP